MILFAATVILAGIVANDPLIAALGVFILVVGVAVFAFRQIMHGDGDTSDESGFKAGIVQFRAPAALVAVVVGALLVLIGRGALTVGNLTENRSDEAASTAQATTPDDPPVVAPPVTTIPATTTTIPSTSTTPRATVENPYDGETLPTTGAGQLLWFGVTIVAGGRWMKLSARSLG